MTSYEIQDLFYSKTDSQKVGILHRALEEMESYNGNSQLTCIGMAMGFTTEDGETWEKKV